MNSNPILLYIHDPMCSWCYGFKPTLNALTNQLKDKIDIKYLLGGLAPDTNETMPDSMREQIKLNWNRIEKTIPGTNFNYNFWNHCTPKRSTYPSCRALIAAKKQHSNSETEMINAIQQAYYTQARNPSDYSVLYELAEETGLNKQQFKLDIHSTEVNNELQLQISRCRKIGADSLPSLYLLNNNAYHPVVLDYNNSDIIIEHINSLV